MRPDEVIQSERRATETMSETSEGTAATSVSGKSSYESREELRDIAALLGISDPDDLHQDRFRVDRRKLEQMLLGEHTDFCSPFESPYRSAADIFLRIRPLLSRPLVFARSSIGPRLALRFK